MADEPYSMTADEVIVVRHGEPVPPVLVVTPDGSVVRADELPKYPPPGLSPEELETWYENEEDERLFGEGI